MTSNPYQLTRREAEAIELQLQGYGRRRIASTLGISESSARARLRNAHAKILAARAATDPGGLS